MCCLKQAIGCYKKACNLAMTSDQLCICMNNVKILLEEYGFINSLLVKGCVDKDGNVIPWYTYPAIEYISKFDLSEKWIFEYGSGNSSLFWASMAKKVVSVDNNELWYEFISKQAPVNLDLSLQRNMDDYINYIDKFNVKFDVIIIDGAYRYETTNKALSAISETGLIIFDNSDRAIGFEEYSKATKLLRNSGFIQVDMSGFGPLNYYTWTTSLFFTQKFNFRTKDSIQPQRPLGGRFFS